MVTTCFPLLMKAIPVIASLWILLNPLGGFNNSLNGFTSVAAMASSAPTPCENPRGRFVISLEFLSKRSEFKALVERDVDPIDMGKVTKRWKKPQSKYTNLSLWHIRLYNVLSMLTSPPKVEPPLPQIKLLITSRNIKFSHNVSCVNTF